MTSLILPKWTRSVALDGIVTFGQYPAQAEFFIFGGNGERHALWHPENAPVQKSSL